MGSRLASAVTSRRAARDRQGAAAGPRQDAADPALQPRAGGRAWRGRRCSTRSTSVAAHPGRAPGARVRRRRRRLAARRASSSSRSAGRDWASVWRRPSMTSRRRRCWSAWTRPQLTPALLARRGCARWRVPSVDAVLGPALDGGYWSIGFSGPCAGRVRRRPDEPRATWRRAAGAAARARAARPRAAARCATSTRSRTPARSPRARPHTRFARALAAI